MKAFLAGFVFVTFVAGEAIAQGCNPQYPATCIGRQGTFQPSYQQPFYVPPPPEPRLLQPMPPPNWGTTTYTDQYGNVLGRAHRFGGTTTYTDPYGNILGYGKD